MDGLSYEGMSDDERADAQRLDKLIFSLGKDATRDQKIAVWRQVSDVIAKYSDPAPVFIRASDDSPRDPFRPSIPLPDDQYDVLAEVLGEHEPPHEPLI
jgi:hypothetical protein